MRKFILVFLPIAFIILFASFDNSFPDRDTIIPSQQQAIQQDSTFDAEAALEALKAQIAGKESLPAEEVFEDIQILKGFPAGKVLPIMKMAFNNSLGVSCDHCHNTNNWASNEKPTKKIARDMWGMVGKINRDLLAGIEGLQGEMPIVNCTTCHRGDVIPALRLGN